MVSRSVWARPLCGFIFCAVQKNVALLFISFQRLRRRFLVIRAEKGQITRLRINAPFLTCALISGGPDFSGEAFFLFSSFILENGSFFSQVSFHAVINASLTHSLLHSKYNFFFLSCISFFSFHRNNLGGGRSTLGGSQDRSQIMWVNIRNCSL